MVEREVLRSGCDAVFLLLTAGEEVQEELPDNIIDGSVGSVYLLLAFYGLHSRSAHETVVFRPECNPAKAFCVLPLSQLVQ